MKKKMSVNEALNRLGASEIGELHSIEDDALSSITGGCSNTSCNMNCVVSCCVDNEPGAEV